MKSDPWENFCTQTKSLGLNLIVVRTRSEVESAFKSQRKIKAEKPDAQRKPGTRGFPPVSVQSPADIHPAYKSAIILGSAGPKFFRGFQDFQGNLKKGEAGNPNPLDAYTVKTLEKLLPILAPEKPQVAYPFPEKHQVVPFLALLEGLPMAKGGPFGVGIHPAYGPWFAWRALILTTLLIPPTSPIKENPCETCSAPCIKACKAGAAAKTGFRWEICAPERLAAEPKSQPCALHCPARMACPVGAEHTYHPEAITHHGAASLSSLKNLKSQGALPPDPRQGADPPAPR